MIIKIAAYDDKTREKLSADSFLIDDRHYDERLQEITEFVSEAYELYGDEDV